MQEQLYPGCRLVQFCSQLLSVSLRHSSRSVGGGWGEGEGGGEGGVRGGGGGGGGEGGAGFKIHILLVGYCCPTFECHSCFTYWKFSCNSQVDLILPTNQY